MDLFDADGLTGEDRIEVDFLAAQAGSSAMRDHDGFVVEDSRHRAAIGRQVKNVDRPPPGTQLASQRLHRTAPLFIVVH